LAVVVTAAEKAAVRVAMMAETRAVVRVVTRAA
jgi:hypothetical protein